MELCARIVLVSLFDQNRVLAARNGGVALAHAAAHHVVALLVLVHHAGELGDVAGVVGCNGQRDAVRVRAPERVRALKLLEGHRLAR